MVICLVIQWIELECLSNIVIIRIRYTKFQKKIAFNNDYEIKTSKKDFAINVIANLISNNTDGLK